MTKFVSICLAVGIIQAQRRVEQSLNNGKDQIVGAPLNQDSYLYIFEYTNQLHQTHHPQ